METARSAALIVLKKCRKSGEWANEGLKRELKGMESREAALATRLVYGVMQNRMLLDHFLGELSSLPLDKLNQDVLDILRLGGYQLLFMDNIPVHAAVDEAVKLTKNYAKNPKTAGFVNGVLRNLERQKKDAWEKMEEEWRVLGEKRSVLEEKQEKLEEISRTVEAPWQRLSILYSHPLWLVEEFSSQLGGDIQEVEKILEADNLPAPMTAQVNTLKISVEALCGILKEQGVSVERHPWGMDCLLLENTGDLEKLDAFRQGLFYIQDPAAKAAVLAAAPKAGERVLDLCAAPGGKSFAAAVAMGDRGEIVSRDIYPWKVSEIERGAARLGISSLKAVVGDAMKAEKEMEMEEGFDLVIADVPCSGLGIIRKKPDIRYKDPAAFQGLAPIQEAILETAGRAARPGGRVLYATCTLRREENEDRTAAFLRRHGGRFTLEREETFWPHRTGTDGFYYAVLRREAGA